MNKWTLKTIWSLIQMILVFVEKLIKLIGICQDLLDDGKVNGSVEYFGSDLQRFIDDLNHHASILSKTSYNIEASNEME